MDRITSTLFLCAILVASKGSAQTVPAMINYQGRLTSAGGQPLVTADYDLTFRIFDAIAGGQMVWGPQIFDGAGAAGHGPTIPVVQGYFNVILGPMDTSDRSLVSAFSASPRFIEVQVGTNSPISPRQSILSAPFAFQSQFAAQSQNAQLLAGRDWSSILVGGANDPAQQKIRGDRVQDNGINTPQIAFGAVLTDKLGNEAVTTAKIAASAVTSAQIGTAAIDPRHLSPEAIAAVILPGSMISFGGANVPSGWLLCDGRVISRNTYSRLFAAIGTTWGAGDGSSTFALPDLRGRIAIGAGAGVGLTARSVGERYGSEAQTLTSSQMPAHFHHLFSLSPASWVELSPNNFPALAANSESFNGGGNANYAYWLSGKTDPSTHGRSSTVGSGAPFSIVPPTAGVNAIIKY